MFKANFPFSLQFSYSIGRTFITVSLLITFLFNNIEVLFPKYVFDTYNEVQALGFLKETNLYFIFGHKNALLLKIITLIILTINLLGFFPRTMGVLLFYILVSFLNFCPVIEGGDVISMNLSLILLPIIFMDNRKHLYDFGSKIFNTNYKKIIANNLFLIIKIQVAFLYLNGCIGKLFVHEWVDGTASYYYSLSNVYGFGIKNEIIKQFLSNDYINVLMTWGTLTTEFLLFSCLFFNNDNYRRRMFWVGVFFHLAIIFIFGLVSFFFAMLGALVLYLTSKKEIINYDNQI